MSQLQGFSPAAWAFFDGLEEDNSRAYWTAHADVFEAEVKAPLAALVASLPKAYQPFRVFRMHRDLRFSADKSPYKTQHSAIHTHQGLDHYLQVSAAGLLVATGIYWMERDQLQRFREAVDDEASGTALDRLLRRLERAGTVDVDHGVGTLKTAPQGYPRDHRRIRWLRQRGLIATAGLAGPELADGEAVRAFVLDVFATARPMNRWLAEQVGPHVEE